MTDNLQNFDNLQERNQQVLHNISQLQTQEKELYDSLEDVSLSSEQKQQIINRINEISQMRINLYASLKDMFSFVQKNVSSSKNTLDQSIEAVDILENELNQSKRRINLIEDQKNNKLRLVGINTYFGKRYNSHARLMKTIVILCIPIFILSILANKGILPSNIYSLLVTIILVISCVIIGLQLFDMLKRSNMNWDEYSWYFDEDNAPTDSDLTDSAEDSSSSDPWNTVSATCIGSACCYDGSTYDSEQNICVPNMVNQIGTGTKTEAFKGLGKYGYNQIKTFPINTNISPVFASLSMF